MNQSMKVEKLISLINGLQSNIGLLMDCNPITMLKHEMYFYNFFTLKKFTDKNVYGKIVSTNILLSLARVVVML
jgi:hypothetical protein